MEELKPLIEAKSSNKEKIVIIGTGNYGIALGKRFLMFGFEVIYGSRNPNKAYLRECFGKMVDEQFYDVTTIEDAWNKSDSIVFLAVNAKDQIYEEIVSKIIESIKKQKSNELKSKILIEISNRSDDEDLRKVKTSNAQKLDDMIFSKLNESSIINYKIHVVKGFNLIDAYSLSSFIDTSGKKKFYDKTDLLNTNMVVPICGNEASAKTSVIDLCHKIGLRAYDLGQLSDSSLKLELTNRKTFDTWFYPSISTIVIFFGTFIWIFFINFFFPKKPITFSQYLENFSLLSHINKVSGYTSLQQLSYIYLASVFAMFYQLKYSSKYHRFPKYLDVWLKTRKQFGLWAFLLATLHLIISMILISPNYFKPWFRSFNERMTLHAELNILTGVLAFILMLLVALTSIRSIGESLNWNEWRFVQTKLGLTCLAMGALHSFVMFSRHLIERINSGQFDALFLLTRPKLVGIFVPVLVLILRFLFAYFPPLSNRIKRIREGETCGSA